MKHALLTIVYAATIGTGSAAHAADPAIGLWQTPPDRKNLVSHIEIAPCGTKLCGKVLRAFDQNGAQVKTANIGKRIFWDVVPLGSGQYGQGTAWVPLLNVTAKASMQLAGNSLIVRGCRAGICDGQTWQRLD